eukprot:80856-Rhodomonas_salina.3
MQIHLVNRQPLNVTDPHPNSAKHESDKQRTLSLSAAKLRKRNPATHSPDPEHNTNPLER